MLLIINKYTIYGVNKQHFQNETGILKDDERVTTMHLSIRYALRSQLRVGDVKEKKKEQCQTLLPRNRLYPFPIPTNPKPSSILSLMPIPPHPYFMRIPNSPITRLPAIGIISPDPFAFYPYMLW